MTKLSLTGSAQTAANYNWGLNQKLSLIEDVARAIVWPGFVPADEQVRERSDSMEKG